MTPITSLDFVAIPSQDAERSREFYGETLGLRPDDRASTSSGSARPASASGSRRRWACRSRRRRTPTSALHVDDVAAARAELEAKGVEFAGETFDTGVCHMAFFTDPDGNDLMLHPRYSPRP